MKSLFIVLFSLTTIFSNNPLDGTLEISSDKSELLWKAYKVTGSHEGTLKLNAGSLTFENELLTGGNFSIDMTSINTTDLEGDTKGKLDGHLKSPDFFAVEEFSTANLVITKVAPRGLPGDYKITGDLTIKGITKEIKFNALIVEEENGTSSATALIKVDRSDYNVKYGSGSFLANLGDKTIYDEFDLNVKLVF